MPILLSCSCGKRLRIPDANAGKKVRCPGCGQVLTAPPPTPPEGVDELEVVSDPTEAPRKEADHVQRSPVRPPPRSATEDRPRPKSGDSADVEVVKLTLAESEDERWRLELAEDEVRLIDKEGEVAMSIPSEEANNRIQFPSFWMSVKYIQFLGPDGHTAKFGFHPDKKALKRIRSYLDHVLRQDPKARRKFKQRGLTIFLLGLVATIIGGGMLTYLLVSGTLRDWRYKGIGISIAGIVGGLVFTGVGIGMYLKAVSMGRQEDEDDLS